MGMPIPARNMIAAIGQKAVVTLHLSLPCHAELVSASISPLVMPRVGRDGPWNEVTDR
jgi:hypothetical protein